MKSKIWWIIGVIVVAVALTWLWKNWTGDNTAVTNSTPRTLRELLGSDISQKCTFYQTGDDISNNGTVYVTIGQLRGDFVSLFSGKSIEAHMIVKGEDTYTWITGYNVGIKSTTDNSAIGGSGQPKNIDLDQPLDYNCEAWVSEAGQFELPANIQFTTPTN